MLGEHHREVRRRRDPAGAAGVDVGRVQAPPAVRLARAELEQHQRELLARPGRSGGLQVEDHEPSAGGGRSEVVGPQVAVADLDLRRPAVAGLRLEHVRDQRGQPVGVRRTRGAQLVDERRPGVARRPGRRTSRATGPAASITTRCSAASSRPTAAGSRWRSSAARSTQAWTRSQWPATSASTAAAGVRTGRGSGTPPAANASWTAASAAAASASGRSGTLTAYRPRSVSSRHTAPV